MSAVPVSASSKCSVNTHEKELPIAVPPGQESEDSDLSITLLSPSSLLWWVWLVIHSSE